MKEENLLDVPSSGLNELSREIDKDAIIVPYERFKIIKKLGAGGSGEVYLIEDKDHNNAKYALKKIFRKGALADLPNSLKRMKQELEVASRLSRDNQQNEDNKNLVITYPELYFWDETYCYLMEYVHGITLAQLFEEERRITNEIPEIVAIMTQLLDGLSVLHKNKIWHRDLKLENILYREDGRVKICDFGLIKEKGAEALTLYGEKFGTIWYIAPEYLIKDKCDHKSDIYACGMILYELLRGKRRFPSDNYGAGEIAKRLRKHLAEKNSLGISKKKYPPSDYYRNKLETRIMIHLDARKFRHPFIKVKEEHHYLYEIALKALSYEPEERFSTVIKMKEAIFKKKKNKKGNKILKEGRGLIKKVIIISVISMLSIIIISTLIGYIFK